MLSDAEILPDGTRLIARFAEADASLLRDLASVLVAEPGVIALLGAQTGDQAIYVFGCSDNVRHDMGMLLRDCARQHGGKGGGKPSFAQGGGSPAILPAAVEAVRSVR